MRFRSEFDQRSGHTPPRRRRNPTIQRVIRRRRTFLAGGWATLLLLAALIFADRFGYLGSRGQDWDVYDKKSFVVTRVVDGDTIHVGDTKVRLLGVDAPELNNSNQKPPDHWAKRSTEYVRARCNGKQVTLRLEETQTRDRYGRLLAYVYLSDAEMLNLSLVRDGQAYADRRFRHTYKPQFEMAENEARKKQRGLWKEVTDDQMPAWRRKWLVELRSGR